MCFAEEVRWEIIREDGLVAEVKSLVIKCDDGVKLKGYEVLAG